MDRLEEELAEIERESARRVDQSVRWWFGHMERMNEQHMAWRMITKHVGGEYTINSDVVG